MAKRINEGRHLRDLLDELDIGYDADKDTVAIPCATRASDILSEDHQIEVVAHWRTGFITIEYCVLELEGDQVAELDRRLLLALLDANYEMDVCRFGIDPDEGVCLLLDVDARTLDARGLDERLDDLLEGIDTFAEVVAGWLDLVGSNGEVEAEELCDGTGSLDLDDSGSALVRLVKDCLVALAEVGAHRKTLVRILSSYELPASEAATVMEAAEGEPDDD